MSDELIINSDNVVHNFHNQTHNLYPSTLGGYLFLDLSMTSIPLRVIGPSFVLLSNDDKKRASDREGLNHKVDPLL